MTGTEYVTRYEKRDRSGYFIIFAFLVSFDSYACVQYLRQKPSYSRLNTHGSPVVQKSFFEIRAPLATSCFVRVAP